MIIISKKLVPKYFDGITLYPFVIVKSVELLDDAVFLNHEKIHLKQQLELFLVGFYVWYFCSFVFHFIRFRNRQKAYRAICFEQEAYLFEKDLTYLKRRTKFAFMRL